MVEDTPLPSKADDGASENAASTNSEASRPASLFAANAPPIMSTDVSSLMQQLATLQSQNVKLEELLQSRKAQLTEKDNFIHELTQKKREEMQNEIKHGIDMWLQTLKTKDQSTKDEFKKGLLNLADNTKENGVWEVVCCASAQHKDNVNEIARLQQENNALRTHLGGSYNTFQLPHNRVASTTAEARARGGDASASSELGKRQAESELQAPAAVSDSYWDAFERTVTKNAYNLSPAELKNI